MKGLIRRELSLNKNPTEEVNILVARLPAASVGRPTGCKWWRE
jgi:hypothetical protein